MQVTRRAVLKALGISPVAANTLAQQLGTMAASGAGLFGDRDAPPDEAAGISEKPEVFKSVSSWWKAGGEEETKRQARYVAHFDADILSRHLPLQAKVALQRQRNFEHHREARWREMGKRIARYGLIKWWP